MTPKVHVTDHSILRYAERFLGLDVEQCRLEIIKAVKDGASVRAKEIKTGGVSYVLQYNPSPVVVTVKSLDMVGAKPTGREPGHPSNNRKLGPAWLGNKDIRAKKRRINMQGGRDHV